MDKINYSLAIRYLKKNDTIADIACGNGLGTHMLSSHVSKVYGYDIDDQAIRRARKSRLANEFYARFDVDISDLPVSGLNAIVCMETIEHVKEPGTVLKKFHAVLSDAGLLILSTPNASWSTHTNPYHISEMTGRQLGHALSAAHFRSVAIYGAERASSLDKIRMNACIRRILDRVPLGIREAAPQSRTKYYIKLDSFDDTKDYRQLLVVAKKKHSG